MKNCSKNHDCRCGCACCRLDKVCRAAKRRWTLLVPAAIVAHAVAYDNCLVAMGGVALAAVLVELQAIKKMLRNCCWY